jgi:hypothetical protein
MKIEPPQQPDEAHQVAARAGAARKVEVAGLDLVPIPRDGELHRADSDGLQPHQLTLPQRARVEVVGKLDRLHVLLRRRGGHRRRQQRREEQQENDQAHQNCLPFRTR